MSNNLSIGTIWQDERTKKYFELVAHSKENNRIQLSTVDNEQSYTTMTEASLRKHYKLIALSMKQFRPETTVTTVSVEELEEEVTTTKQETVKEKTSNKVVHAKTGIYADGSTVKERGGIGRVELPDGKIITGAAYFKDYLELTPQESYLRDGSPIAFLKWKSQSHLLEKFNAKIVYGKKLTK